VLATPQEQVQSFDSGLGEPHSLQNLPVLVTPQLQFQPVEATGSGFCEPHSAQNLPGFSAPQEHFQVFPLAVGVAETAAGGATCGNPACCCC